MFLRQDFATFLHMTRNKTINNSLQILFKNIYVIKNTDYTHVF